MTHTFGNRLAFKLNTVLSAAIKEPYNRRVLRDRTAAANNLLRAFFQRSLLCSAGLIETSGIGGETQSRGTFPGFFVYCI